jgi:hypothetical protein
MTVIDDLQGLQEPKPSGPVPPPKGDGDDTFGTLLSLGSTCFFAIPLFAALKGNWQLATELIVGYTAAMLFTSSLLRLIAKLTKSSA